LPQDVGNAVQVLFTVRDDGVPPLTADQRVTINVNDVTNPPPNALEADNRASQHVLRGKYRLTFPHQRPAARPSPESICAELSFRPRAALRRLRHLWLEVAGSHGQPDEERKRAGRLSPVNDLARAGLLAPNGSPAFHDCFTQIGEESRFEFQQTGKSLAVSLLDRLLSGMAARAGVAPPGPDKVARVFKDFRGLPAFAAAQARLRSGAGSRRKLPEAFAEASRSLRQIPGDAAQLTMFAQLVNDCLGTSLSEAEISGNLRLVNTPVLYGILVREARQYLKRVTRKQGPLVIFRAIRK